MDPQQQQAANQLAAMGAGFVLVFFAIIAAVVAFLIFLYWRILTKAGLSGPLSLLMLVPGVGPLIVPCILAFSDWKVVPVAAIPPGGLTPYPPAYPPTSYPPQGPTL